MSFHSFETNDAVRYGIEKAILLFNLRYWLKKNQANEAHLHLHTDGKKYYWTYNSSLAFERLFPYMKSSTIRKYMTELETEGIILSNNFNENKFDRKKWYTLPEFELKSSVDQNDQSNDISDQSNDISDQSNDISDQSIADSNPDNNLYNLPLIPSSLEGAENEVKNSELPGENKKSLKEKIAEFKQLPGREERIKIVNNDVELRTFYVNKIYDVYKQKIQSKARLTDTAKSKLLVRLKEFTPGEIAKAIQNFSNDVWWMENNAFRGIKWFFHTEDRVDQFLHLSEDTRRKTYDNTTT